MPEARDPQSLIDRAGESAAAGDYATAERLLRQAAVLQEASLGPLHPDLAHTLNNLAVVCEIVDNPIDAEHYYRRACAIATAVLEPDHPFVATSRKNLEDFCAARGKAVKLPDAVSRVTDPHWAVSTGNTPDPADSALEPQSSGPSSAATAGGWNRSRVVAVLAASLALAVAVGVWSRSRERTEPPPGSTVSSSPRTAESPARETAPSTAALDIDRSGAGGSPAEPPRTVASTTGRPEGGQNAPQPGPRAMPVTQAPTIVAAQLCRTLATGGGTGWRCDPPADPVAPGPLIFYTRVRSATALTVQHRWYRGDRLRRVVPLPIRANMSEGYRTFSRQTVAAEGSGDWRVELSTSDGTVLHTERFVVR